MSSDEVINTWRFFLDLGEEVLRKTNVQDQADVICGYIQESGIYQADIWLNETISRVPGQHNLSLFSSIPQSSLCRGHWKQRELAI